jgi:hypothetical protein
MKASIFFIVGLLIIIMTIFSFNILQQNEEGENEKVFGEFNENKDIVYKNIDCLFEKDGELFFIEACE